jgi:hypothetical protein
LLLALHNAHERSEVRLVLGLGSQLDPALNVALATQPGWFIGPDDAGTVVVVISAEMVSPSTCVSSVRMLSKR